VGDDSNLVFRPKQLGEGGSVRRGRFHGEAARPVLAKVRGDVFARFQAVAAKRRSRTRNSQFGLLGPVLRATTTAVQMEAPVRNILDTTSYSISTPRLLVLFLNFT
jgi:hypothetical protein